MDNGRDGMGNDADGGFGGRLHIFSLFLWKIPLLDARNDGSPVPGNNSTMSSARTESHAAD